MPSFKKWKKNQLNIAQCKAKRKWIEQLIKEYMRAGKNWQMNTLVHRCVVHTIFPPHYSITDCVLFFVFILKYITILVTAYWYEYKRIKYVDVAFLSKILQNKCLKCMNCIGIVRRITIDCYSSAIYFSSHWCWPLYRLPFFDYHYCVVKPPTLTINVFCFSQRLVVKCRQYQPNVN